jgi:hypothetical protein
MYINIHIHKYKNININTHKINIHRWLIDLEKKLDEFALEGSNKKFRLFLSSDAANSIPIGLLNRCIKVYLYIYLHSYIYILMHI